jgi:hypothetical protein
MQPPLRPPLRLVEPDESPETGRYRLVATFVPPHPPLEPAVIDATCDLVRKLLADYWHLRDVQVIVEPI